MAELGAGVELDEERPAPAKGKVFEAHLEVGYALIPLKIRVVYVRHGVAGLEYIGISEFIRGAIRTIFELELLGAAMKLKDPGTDSDDDAADYTLHYEDDRDNFFEVVVREEQVESFKVVCGAIGDSVEWSRENSLRLFKGLKDYFPR